MVLFTLMWLAEVHMASDHMTFNNQSASFFSKIREMLENLKKQNVLNAPVFLSYEIKLHMKTNMKNTRCHDPWYATFLFGLCDLWVEKLSLEDFFLFTFLFLFLFQNLQKRTQYMVCTCLRYFWSRVDFAFAFLF